MNMREFNPFIPMVDFFLCVMMSVFVLFMASLAEVNPPVPKKAKDASTIATEGIFVVVMEWPADSANDLDLHVMGPERKVVYFSNPSAGLMHLERDDRGTLGDTAKDMTGGEVVVRRNEERVIIRAIVPGEYCVNVHLYAKYDGAKEVPVTVSLYRLKGSDAPLVQRTFTLRTTGEERTMFRMTLDEEEKVSDVNELQRSTMGGDP